VYCYIFPEVGIRSSDRKPDNLIQACPSGRIMGEYLKIGHDSFLPDRQFMIVQFMIIPTHDSGLKSPSAITYSHTILLY
jgi:hypothetical protein